MKNKTVAALMAAIALCAALTACGSDSGETSCQDFRRTGRNSS